VHLRANKTICAVFALFRGRRPAQIAEVRLLQRRKAVSIGLVSLRSHAAPLAGGCRLGMDLRRAGPTAGRTLGERLGYRVAVDVCSSACTTFAPASMAHLKTLSSSCSTTVERPTGVRLGSLRPAPPCRS
jgi:hypothetical protein